MGELKPLMLVEVKYSSIEEADSFQPADWFERKVTLDKLYKNKVLVMNPQATKEDL